MKKNILNKTSNRHLIIIIDGEIFIVRTLNATRISQSANENSTRVARDNNGQFCPIFCENEQFLSINKNKIIKIFRLAKKHIHSNNILRISHRFLTKALRNLINFKYSAI